MATLGGFFALLGGVLATLGVYGVSAYAVSQRIGEIGLRLTLGATARMVVRLVVGEALPFVGSGLAIGALLAVLAMKGAGAMLYGLEPHDLPTLLAAVTVLGTVALAATYLPARRAAQIDPMQALRRE